MAFEAARMAFVGEGIFCEGESNPRGFEKDFTPVGAGSQMPLIDDELSVLDIARFHCGLPA